MMRGRGLVMMSYHTKNQLYTKLKAFWRIFTWGYLRAIKYNLSTTKGPPCEYPPEVIPSWIMQTTTRMTTPIQNKL